MPPTFSEIDAFGRPLPISGAPPEVPGLPGEEDPEDNGVVDAVGGMNENLGTILERIFAANEQAANSLRQSAEIEAQRSVMKSATEQRSALFGRELVR